METICLFILLGFVGSSFAVNSTTTDGTGTGIVTTPQTQCPQGYTCQTCKKGTYSVRVGVFYVNCLPCPPGLYCDTDGSASPTGQCEAGYYCLSGSTTATPSGTNGNICPNNHYCPKGTGNPIPCPIGSKNNQQTGLKSENECQPPFDQCPLGHSCAVCPMGHFCANEQQPTKCPSGTYNDRLKATKMSDCMPCLAGHYCRETGLVRPSGLCWGGCYCEAGTKVPEKICPIGTYCPAGSASAITCPRNFYCPVAGSTFARPCPFGTSSFPGSMTCSHSG